MEVETATPEAAPVEAPAEDNALAQFLAEDTEAQPDEAGDAEQAPEAEGEAQEAESQTEGKPPEEQPTYKVKVRGEDIDVPLNELLNGYSRTEDYKAKTAEVAEQRRQLATEYADKLEQQVQLFTSIDPILSQAQSIDWNALAQQDPAAYVQLKAAFDQRVGAVQQAAGEIERIRQDNASKQAESVQEYHREQRDALVRAMPELADEAKLGTFAKETVDYLKAYGFTDDVIKDTDDHRALLIADKARKWDALQRAKQTAETKKAPPANQRTLRPQAPESPRAPKQPGPTASEADRRAWVLAQLD